MPETKRTNKLSHYWVKIAKSKHERNSSKTRLLISKTSSKVTLK